MYVRWVVRLKGNEAHGIDDTGLVCKHSASSRMMTTVMMCICVCLLVCLCTMYVPGPHRGQKIPWNWSCKLLCGCWELRLGLLED